MLTPDLVRARRSRGELVLVPLDKDRALALELSGALLALARDHVGRTRGELEQALGEVGVSPQKRKLYLGLCKLVEDGCEFAVESSIEPAALRSEVFLKASAERRALADGAPFGREALLESIASAQATSVERLERALFADLRGSHVLLAAPRTDAAALVGRYERAQRQAVLLRSVRVVAEVHCAVPAAYRNLFNKLKFRRLLYRIERLATAGYRIEIDGPFSLFDSVTKYGLALSLVLPALEECDALKLRAELRWGKAREPLFFQFEHRSETGRGERSPLPDDVSALLEAFTALESAWSAAPTEAVIDLPGVGVCVPDLAFTHRPSGARVFLEVLGFWSRDAVFRRIEMARRGVGKPLLFAVSSRLRVSEALLDDVETAALYVYKGTMNARAVERKLEALRDPGA
jgi:uncharacterized protein